jgi:hypothetical protein
VLLLMVLEALPLQEHWPIDALGFGGFQRSSRLLGAVSVIIFRRSIFESRFLNASRGSAQALAVQPRAQAPTLISISDGFGGVYVHKGSFFSVASSTVAQALYVS